MSGIGSGGAGGAAGGAGYAEYILTVNSSGLTVGLKQAQSATNAATANINKSLNSVGKGAAGASKGVAGLGANMQKSFAGVARGAGLAMAAFTPIPAGITAIGTSATFALGAAGVAVGKFVSSSLSQFAEFDHGMRLVWTIMADDSETAFAAMEEHVLEFSQQMGVVTDDVIPALYESLSSGVPEQNVFAFMEQAQKGAVAGNVELMTVVHGLSTVVNAYGAANLTAAHANDVMFSGVKTGTANYEDLSKVMANVNPIAAQLGVSFDETVSAVAAMTAQGAKAAVSSRDLRGILTELSTEGKRAFDIFSDAAGKSFPQFIAEGGTLREAMEIMLNRANELGVGINTLFTRVESGRGALQLSANDFHQFDVSLQDVARSAGATDEAYGKVEESLERRFERMGAAIERAQIAAGAALADPAEKFANWVSTHGDDITGFFTALAETVVTAATAIEIMVDGVSMLGSIPIPEWLGGGEAGGADREPSWVTDVKKYGTMAFQAVFIPATIYKITSEYNKKTEAEAQRHQAAMDKIAQAQEKKRQASVTQGFIEDLFAGEAATSKFGGGVGALLGVLEKYTGITLQATDIQDAFNLMQEGGLPKVQAYIAAMAEENLARTGLISLSKDHISSTELMTGALDELAASQGTWRDQVQSDQMSVQDWVGAFKEMASFSTDGGLNLVPQVMEAIGAGTIEATDAFEIFTSTGQMNGQDLLDVLTKLREAAGEDVLDAMQALEAANIGGDPDKIAEATANLDLANNSLNGLKDTIYLVSEGLDQFAGAVPPVVKASLELEFVGARAAERMDIWAEKEKQAQQGLEINEDLYKRKMITEQEYLDNKELLTWATERYAGGVADESVALLDSIKKTAHFTDDLDKLNQAYKDGDLDQKQYTASVAALSAAYDPTLAATANMTAAFEGISEALDTSITKVVLMLYHLGVLDGTEVELILGISVEDAEAGINQTEEDLKDLQDHPTTTDLLVNGEPALQDVQTFKDQLAPIKDEPTTATIEVESKGHEEALNNVETVTGSAKDLEAENPYIVAVDAPEAGTTTIALNGIGQAGQDLVARPYVVETDAPTAGPTQEKLEGVKQSADDIVLIGPVHVDTSAPGAVTTAGELNNISYAVGLIPTDVTITVTANVGPAMVAIEGVRGWLPSSPAKAGPFKTLPTWDGAFENLPVAAYKYTDEASDLAAQSEALTMEKAELPENKSWENEARNWAATNEAILEIVNESADKYSEEFLEHLKTYVDTSSAAVGLLSDTLEFVHDMGDFVVEYGEWQRYNVANLKFISEFAVQSVGDSSRLFKEKWLEHLQTYADAASASVTMLSDTMQFVKDMGDVVVEYGEWQNKNIANLKFIAEKAVVSVGESAEIMDTLFLENIELYADAVSQSVTALQDTFALVLDLQTESAEAAIAAEGLGENIAKLADISKIIATEFGRTAQDWDEEVNPQAEALSADVGNAVGAISDTLEFLTDLSVIETALVMNADEIADKAQNIAEKARIIADVFRTVSESWEEEAIPEMTALATNVSDATGALSDTLSFLTDLSEVETALDHAAIFVQLQALQIAERAKLIANAFREIARGWGEEANPEITAMAANVSDSVGALGDTLSFLIELADITDESLLSAADVARLAGLLSERARIIADAFRKASEGWGDEVDPAIQAFSENAQASLAVISAVPDALKALLTFGDKELDIDWYVEQLITNVRLMMDAIETLNDEWVARGEPEILEFAENAQAAASVITGAADAYTALEDVSAISLHNVQVFVANWRIILDLALELSEIAQDYLAGITTFAEAAGLMAQGFADAASIMDTLTGEAKDDTEDALDNLTETKEMLGTMEDLFGPAPEAPGVDQIVSGLAGYMTDVSHLQNAIKSLAETWASEWSQEVVSVFDQDLGMWVDELKWIEKKGLELTFADEQLSLLQDIMQNPDLYPSALADYVAEALGDTLGDLELFGPEAQLANINQMLAEAGIDPLTEEQWAEMTKTEVEAIDELGVAVGDHLGRLSESLGGRIADELETTTDGVVQGVTWAVEASTEEIVKAIRGIGKKGGGGTGIGPPPGPPKGGIYPPGEDPGTVIQSVVGPGGVQSSGHPFVQVTTNMLLDGKLIGTSVANFLGSNIVMNTPTVMSA